MDSIFSVAGLGHWPLADSYCIVILSPIRLPYVAGERFASVSPEVSNNPMVSSFESTSNNFNYASLIKL